MLGSRQATVPIDQYEHIRDDDFKDILDIFDGKKQKPKDSSVQNEVLNLPELFNEKKYNLKRQKITD